MANAFVHVELNTTDVDKAKGFYGKLFNWKLEDMPMEGGVYTIIKPEKGTGGGMMKHPMPGAPSAWLPYVEVADISETTERARLLGAAVLLEPREGPIGWRSVVAVPAGAELAFWQPKI